MTPESLFEEWLNETNTVAQDPKAREILELAFCAGLLQGVQHPNPAELFGQLCWRLVALDVLDREGAQHAVDSIRHIT